MSLGDTLRRAREARRISLNQAALETRIRQSVLEALEDSDYTAVPPRPFLRGLLRNYALYLHLDADTTLDEYDIDTGYKFPPPQLPPQEPEPRAPVSPPNYATPVETFSIAPEATPEPYTFPPFQIPTSGKTNGAVELTQAPPLEAFFQVAPEDEVPPSAPLNLSQEPPTLGQRIGGTRIPEAVAILALAISLYALTSVGFTTFQDFKNPFVSLATPRPTTIATATIPPGSTPTGIPTLAQTLEPPTAVAVLIGPTVTVTETVVAGSVEPTQIALLSATSEIPPDAQMTLSIEATGEVGAWIIVDEDEVFNGTLTKATRSFTAHQRLFIQIKNIGNGRVFFQGTRILPRNQLERTELARAWLMSPQGIPVIVPPTPYPSPVALTEFPTATAAPSDTPTPSTTPTSTNTLTPTPTVTLTVTPTSTATLTITSTSTSTPTTTPTTTRTLTPTPTQTPTHTVSVTSTPTGTAQTLTPTATRPPPRSASPTSTRCTPNPLVECE